MLEDLITSYDVYRHILAILIGMPRLFIIAMVAPFLGSAVVTGQLRMVLVFSLYLVLHPALVAQIPDLSSLDQVFTINYVLILVKEIILGLLIGYIGALLFWAIQSAGFFIDNQRGASQAEGSEILSGDQTSPTGGFFFQAITYLFFVSGGFLTYISVVYGTYMIFPPISTIALNIDYQVATFFAEKFTWIMMNMLLLAAPISIACLLTDVSLGLMNRFASQLNVYVLAMPIKSGMASFLICFYFLVLLDLTPTLYNEANVFIKQLLQILTN